MRISKSLTSINSTIFVILCALAISTTVGISGSKMGSTFHENQSYHFDAISYSYQNTLLFKRLETESKWSLIKNELLNNFRNPVRNIFLIIFSPSLLGKQMGHLGTTIPILFLFLLFLGLFLHNQTGSRFYTLGCLVLFCSSRSILHPNNGLISNLMDFPAALLAGISVISLFNFFNTKKLKWICWFAVFGNLTFLSRFVGGFYFFEMVIPLLLIILGRHWFISRNGKISLLYPIGLMVLITFLISGYQIIAHLKNVLEFYFTYSIYAIEQGFMNSVKFVFPLLQKYLGTKYLLALFLLFAINFRFNSITKKNKWEYLLYFIPPVLHILFLIFIIEVTVHYSSLTYAMPVLFLAFTGSVLWKKSTKNKYREVYGVLLLIFSVAFFTYNYVHIYNESKNPIERFAEGKKLNMALANKLKDEDDKILWNCYFDEYSWIPTMETFYRYGKLPLPAGQDYFFGRHETVWNGAFPKWPIEKIQQASYENTSKWVNIAVIFEDSTKADSLHFLDPTTKEVAKYFSRIMPADSNWIKLFTIPSFRYGNLSGYRNLNVTGKDGYNKRLHSKVLVKPS